MKDNRLVYAGQSSFYLREYQTSMSVLTLSGNEFSNQGDFRVDISFSQVFYLEIPAGFPSLKIRKANIHQIKNFNIAREIESNRDPEFNNLFILESEGVNYFIGALRVVIKRTQLPG